MLIEQPILKPYNKQHNTYQLVEDYKYVSDAGIEIIVPKYFISDGATIPRCLWSIIYSPFLPKIIGPAIVHDWNYFSNFVSFEEANEIFDEMLLKNGANPTKVKIIKLFVDIFGYSHYKQTPEKSKKFFDFIKRLEKIN